MAQTDRQTNRLTWRIVDQIGPEGLFVEKMCDFCVEHKILIKIKNIQQNKGQHILVLKTFLTKKEYTRKVL